MAREEAVVAEEPPCSKPLCRRSSEYGPRPGSRPVLSRSAHRSQDRTSPNRPAATPPHSQLVDHRPSCRWLSSSLEPRPPRHDARPLHGLRTPTDRQSPTHSELRYQRAKELQKPPSHTLRSFIAPRQPRQPPRQAGSLRLPCLLKFGQVLVLKMSLRRPSRMWSAATWTSA